MKKLRLLLFPDCDRDCPGCCNKGWDLESLPVCTNLEEWDEINITGGEPMLNPARIVYVASGTMSATKIYVYTAKVTPLNPVLWVLQYVNGLTLTLHEPKDVGPFLELNKELSTWENVSNTWSLRLNVFKGVHLPLDTDLSLWKVKDNIQWIKDCPLPTDEVFMRMDWRNLCGKSV